MVSEEEVEPIHKQLNATKLNPFTAPNAPKPKPTHQEQAPTLKLDDDDDVFVEGLEMKKNCVVTEEEEEAVRVKEEVDGVNTYTPAFLAKTFEMVEDPGSDPIVSWSATRDSFVVWDSKDFSKNLLPKYFNHNNLLSFVRQLYLYRFRKVRGLHRWEFANEAFQGGKKHLLKNIKRKRQRNRRKKNEKLDGVDMVKTKRPKMLGTTPNVEHRHQGSEQLSSFQSELDVMYEKLMADSYVVDEEVYMNKYSNIYRGLEDLIRKK